MARRPVLPLLLVLALLLAACGAEPSSSSSTTPETDVTATTLAQLRAMDADHLASLHDHDHHDDHHDHHDHHDRHDRHDDHHDHDEHLQRREVVHPNGVTPVRVVVPAIGVDAEVIDLGLEPDGTMEVPSDFAQVGWFARGPRPGRVGPAVLAGHVDDRTGPAVFFRLTELERGDRIEVHGADGEVVVFEVREREQHPKDAFPTERVYAGTPGPELRLVTCGGVFDRGERSYRDNVIVYAERVDA